MAREAHTNGEMRKCMNNIGTVTIVKNVIHMHIQNGGQLKLSPKTRYCGYAVSVLRS